MALSTVSVENEDKDGLVISADAWLIDLNKALPSAAWSTTPTVGANTYRSLISHGIASKREFRKLAVQCVDFHRVSASAFMRY